MNPVGIGLASICGLLAVYLYLNQSQHVAEHQEESRAEIRCQSAKFDAGFADKWGDSSDKVAKLASKAEDECKQFESKRQANDAATVERMKDKKDLQDTIGNMMK